MKPRDKHSRVIPGLNTPSLAFSDHYTKLKNNLRQRPDDFYVYFSATILARVVSDGGHDTSTGVVLIAMEQWMAQYSAFVVETFLKIVIQ